MVTIREIINHHHPGNDAAEPLFPLVIQTVVVHDQPITPRVLQKKPGLVSIRFPTGAQPMSMSQRFSLVLHRIRIGWRLQPINRIPPGLYKLPQMAGMRPTNEQAGMPTFTELICQGQAAHDMAATYPD